jgi:hypothetical protein
MNRSRAVRRLGLVAACALSTACATTRYTQSRVTALPPAAKGGAGAAASLVLDDLRLSVEPLDRAPRGDGIPNLSLRVTFRPAVLGYSFDPGQVVLRTADGRESRALGRGLDGYVPLGPSESFTLAFDAPVGPGDGAEVTLGGIARGRRRIDPVTLRLARREGVSRTLTRTGEKILTVPLVVLLAPLALAGAATGGAP